MRPRAIALALLPAILAVPAPSPAGTPGMRFELYHVNVLAGDADIRIDDGGTAEQASVDAGAGNDFGLRWVAWASDSALAGGMDLGFLSTQEAAGPMLDANLQTFSFFVGARAREPLAGRNGHGIRPYAFLGLGIVNAEGTMRTQTLKTRFESGQGFGMSPGKPGGVSPYLAAGIEWNVADHVALTLDYRHQRHDVDADVFLSTTTAGFDLDASGIGIGIAFTVPPRAAAGN